MEELIRVYEGDLLNKELTVIAREVAQSVKKDLGLTIPGINFHILPIDELASIVAAQGWASFPQHWELGQSYQIEKRAHQLGVHRIYEIMESSAGKEPTSAYIYKANTLIDIKLVIAHVYGHAHFLLNNWRLKERMLKSPSGVFSQYKERTKEIEQEVGEEKVEEIMDAGKSLENLVDLYLTAREKREWRRDLLETPVEIRKRILKKLERRDEERELPKRREYDVFRFVAENSQKLKDWQKEMLNMQHNIAFFLSPISLLTIINEGFAALVDYMYCIRNRFPVGETFDYLKHRTAGMMRPRCGINPYELGFSLLSYIIEKYGGGAVGGEYEEKKYALERIVREIDFEKGWGKVLEVVALNTDYSLIDTYFNEEFYNSAGRDMFTYAGKSWEPKTWEIESRKFDEVKRALLFRTYNARIPRIYVRKGGVDKETGELFLIHDTEPLEKIGMPREKLTLDPGETEEMLKVLYELWGKPINLKTVNSKGERVTISYDSGGKSVSG